MKVTKVLVNADNEGEIICPSCGKRRAIHVSRHRKVKTPIRVKCHCGYTFTISLEYRLYHRKKATLPGKLIDPTSKKAIDDIIVTSISVTGVGFEVKSFNGINVGDVFEIRFTLDDDFASVIHEEIVVKRVKRNIIGAEFCDQDKYHYELDFYLVPEFSFL